MEQGQCNINFFSLYDIFWVWIIDLRASFRSLRAAVQLHNRLVTFSRLLWFCWPLRVNNFFLSCTWCLRRCWRRNGWDSANAKPSFALVYPQTFYGTLHCLFRPGNRRDDTGASGANGHLSNRLARCIYVRKLWVHCYSLPSFVSPLGEHLLGCKTHLPEHDAR